MSTTNNVAHDSAPTTATAMATRAELPVARAAGGVIPWDAFALMDRLDADAFIAEMQGIASDELVYRIKDGAKETVGLSKGGVDECCTMLVSQGQCIREESIKVEIIGSGEDKEAMFTATIARYAVNPNDGREIKLDQVLGVKREPLYEERAPLTLQSKVAGKKWRHLTYGQALENDEAYGYLEWIRDVSEFDADTKQFVSLLLDGADVREYAMGKRFNPFWYEHGCMKAARNGRSRMIPAGIRAQVIAMAKQTEKVRTVERAETADATPAPTPAPANRPRTARQIRENRNAADAREATAAQSSAENAPAVPVIPRRDQDTAGWKFPFAPHKGVFLDALAVDETTGEVTGYTVSDKLLLRALAWATDILSGKPYERPGGERATLSDADRPRFENTRKALEHELETRRVEAKRANADANAERAAAVPGDGPEPAANPTRAGGGNSGVTDTGNVSSATDASGTDAGTAKPIVSTIGAPTNTPQTADGLPIDDDETDPLPF